MRLRSLTIKLIAAFLFVGLTGVLLISVFVGRRTHDEFDRFLDDQGRAYFLAALTEYHEENQGWQGIERAFPRAFLARSDFRPPPFDQLGILVGADGTVLFGGRREQVGRQVSGRELEQAVPLVAPQGNVVGYFLFDDRFAADRVPDRPEIDFLRSVNEAIFFGAAGAAVIALLLGVVLAWTLTRPIKKLTAATRIIADGQLGHQVDVRRRDELGELATAFNQMSSDLAESSRLRRQMTADIAHDLRTPLSILLGYTEALSDGKLPGSPEVFQVMHNESRHLSHLVDDLRTLSLADAGELTLNRQPCKPLDLLNRTVAAYQAQADQQQVSLRVDIGSELLLVDVDSERMAQVLGNLVGNALRYTPAGGTVSLSAMAGGDTVLLRVADTGTGIEPDALPRVFDRFYRADEARSRGQGESGLGLAIARSIVEAHGGVISVASEPGNGSVFTISLPQPSL
jgi:signal transduction histidine kinase